MSTHLGIFGSDINLLTATEPAVFLAEPDGTIDGGEPKIVSFFAKRARGSMSGWIIRNRITSVRALRDFDLDGYRYDAGRSRTDEPVFTRRS